MRRPLLGMVLLAVIVAGSGCGKKGRPLPPLPRGPLPPSGVAARQLGDAIQVRRPSVGTVDEVSSAWVRQIEAFLGAE